MVKHMKEILIALIIAGLLGLFQFTYTISNRVTRTETENIFILKTLTRIEDKLDRVLEGR